VRVYVMTDLEGVGGVWDWDNPDRSEWSVQDAVVRGRRLLTREVNAVVAGLFAGGARAVLVNDGHGAGYTIDVETLDPRVTLIHGQDRPFWLPLLDERFNATALVGAHAKAGTVGASLAHSMWRGVADYSVNGVSVGEIGLQALIAGHYGVPFVFLSGDEYACSEVADLIPRVVTVATKTGLSTRSASVRPWGKAGTELREGAARSLALAGSIAPYVLEPPLVFREVRVEPDFADSGSIAEPWRRLDDHTREVTVADPFELLRRLHGYS
jgi:D-amino peptidase